MDPYEILVIGDKALLTDYSIYINVAGVTEEPHYFRIDIVDSIVTGPGHFVPTVELLLAETPHFVINPLQASGHLERPANTVVWARSFLIALYDPEQEDAWIIGGITGQAFFEYEEMFAVENKSARVLDKVRRDFNGSVPVLLINRTAAGWLSRFFPANPNETGVP
jgi:hypothetical protein